jgi:hypothetical protein
LLVCRNFAPVSVLKERNLKEYFRNWSSSHPEWHKTSC